MYLMKQGRVAPLARGMEHFYLESVLVIDGVGVCQSSVTRDAMGMYGYREVAKLDSWEDLMPADTLHAIALGKVGLGPLASRTDEELAKLEAAYNSGNKKLAERLIAKVESKASPTRTIRPNPNGLTADDAMRLLGLAHIPEPDPEEVDEEEEQIKEEIEALPPVETTPAPETPPAAPTATATPAPTTSHPATPAPTTAPPAAEKPVKAGDAGGGVQYVAKA